MNNLEKLVNAAYDAAYRRDLDAAEEHLEAIAQLGGTALHTAILSWVDRTIDVIRVPRGGTPGFVLVMDGTDETHDIDQVRPEVAWAGRMLMARVADDRATWKALLFSLPRGDREAIANHLMALLTTMATTAAAAEDDPDPDPDCCALRQAWAADPTTTAARRAVAHLN